MPARRLWSSRCRSKLSGTNGSALTAAANFDQGVYVVDSKNVTVGERVLIDYALRLVEQGLSAADSWRSSKRARTSASWALLDHLQFLKRGGRVPAAAAALGRVLSINPVISVVDGAVELLGKARGSKNGRNLLSAAA